MTKIAIITGASQGIGKNTAEFFQKNNYQVINISRTPCTIANTINISLDLTVKDILIKQRFFIEQHLKKETQIAIVHNAFNYIQDQILTIDNAQFRNCVEVGLIAPISLNQIISPFMGKGSSITYVGSTLSEKAVAGAATYVTLKHALIGLMRSTCQDFNNNPHIHTSCVCPGFTNTEMLSKHIKDPDVLEDICQKVSANRLVSTEEIASLIFYAHNNPVINGSVLHANLGQKES
jgi:3-oxoacyl-[acyl-carrier protein] reductase